MQHQFLPTISHPDEEKVVVMNAGILVPWQFHLRWKPYSPKIEDVPPINIIMKTKYYTAATVFIPCTHEDNETMISLTCMDKPNMLEIHSIPSIRLGLDDEI